MSYRDPTHGGRSGPNNPDGDPGGAEEKNWTCPYCGDQFVSAGTHLTQSPRCP